MALTYLLRTIYSKSKLDMDAQTKKKISMALKGKKKSATHRHKISEAMNGRKLSDKHKLNISKAMKSLHKEIYEPI